MQGSVLRQVCPCGSACNRHGSRTGSRNAAIALRNMLLHLTLFYAGRRDSLMGPLSLSADPGAWLVFSSRKAGKLLAQQ